MKILKKVNLPIFIGAIILVALVLNLIHPIFNSAKEKTIGNEPKESAIESIQILDRETASNDPTENVQAGESSPESPGAANVVRTKNDPAGLMTTVSSTQLTAIMEQAADPGTTALESELKGLHARAAVLMDADTGRVLYEKDGYSEMAMASTTKIMTCIIALEYGNLDDIVTVSNYASIQPAVKLGLRTNEQYRLGDLLYSLMLESHNDVAVAIAEHVGGSVEGFAELMNQKARELGCEKTNFVTPNGLDADGHQTTAQELGLISSYAIKNGEFNKITNTPSYSFTNVTGSRNFTVDNKDQFLNQMEGAFGIKTGFTGNAGYCFVGALKRDDRTFISVVLGSGWPPDKTWKWSDTQRLMNYGLGHFKMREVYPELKQLDAVLVVDGQEASVNLSYSVPKITMLLRDDEEITITYQVPDSLEAPVMKDTEVGNITCYLGEEVLQVVPIYTDQAVKKIDYRYCLDQILKIFFP